MMILSLKGKRPQGGFAILGVIGAMLILAFFGQAVVYLAGTTQEMALDQVDLDAAFYEAQAGTEYGLAKVASGVSAAVASPGITLGRGKFWIAEDASTLTVTGTCGSAQVVQSVHKPNQADCLDIDIHDADTHDDDLKHIDLKKVCGPTVTIDKIILAWTPDNGERLKKLKIESFTAYNDPVGAASGTVLNIADYIITNHNTINLTEINFDSDMDGKSFTLTFVMGDASQAIAGPFTPH